MAERPGELDLAGVIMGGKYRLIAEIGRGGMGSVWRAEHLGWKAPVAIKVMTREVTERPEALLRFEREVRLAAGLRSPHVVQVLDHGVDEATATPFIAMELLEGESLARRLRRVTRLSPAETFRITSHLVRALSRAHAAGIVHRDLKPDNVFLVQNEEESLAKVLDFGVAKWTTPTIPEGGLTRPGSVLGTPFYMSPEQIQGSAEIDHRADLWSLSAIICECLTGKRPFEANDFAQLAVMLLSNTGRPLPSSLGPVPHGFDAWFLRATAPLISQRFQTAREIAQSLAPLCGVSSANIAPDSFPYTEELPAGLGDPASMGGVSRTSSRVFLAGRLGRRPLGLVALTTAIVAVVGGGMAFGYRALVAPSEPPRATSSVVAPPATVRAGDPAAAVSKGSSDPASNPTAPGVRLAVDPAAARHPFPPRTAAESEGRYGREELPVEAATEEDALPGMGSSSDPSRAARLDTRRGKRAGARQKETKRPTRAQSTSEPAQVRQALSPKAPARSTKPRAPESTAGSVNVDGRRIRTSLTPNP